jgi:hypothetical protein
MTTVIKKTLACMLVLVFANRMNAQLSGSYAVPATYTSIAAAINDLNTNGVSGAVTINISAGYTETAPVGGFVLNAIVGASSVNQITFQKSGVGANPLITAFTGTAIPSSATQDGVWWFIGSDYITIDGIDIVDPNTTNPATMEFGYGFYKASATDGCQNNTIKNCVITLKRINNAVGAGPSVEGSRGINVVNATSSSNTVAVTITAASGANSANKFYSNTIQNCNIGIAMIGYADVSPFTLADTGNDIGGTSSLTGNTIINFGGGGTTSESAGVKTLAQYNINISNNTVNNNNGSGVNHAAAIRAIYLNTANGANMVVNNNTLTIKNNGTTTQVSIIETVSGGAANNNTVAITNNRIENCTNTLNTTGVFYGIWNSNPSSNLIITGNTFTNNSTNATSGAVYLIYNNATVPGVINMSNNNLSHTFNNATTDYSGTNYNIYNNGGAITTTLTMANNNFSNYSHANVIGTGASYFVYNSTGCSVTNINNNTFTNLQWNNSASVYLIYNSTSTQNALSVTNNSIVTGFTRLGASGTFYGYYSGASSLGTSTQLFSGNNFSNITSTVSGSGTFYGIYSSDGASSPYPRKTVFNNVISNNVVNTSGTAYGIYMTYLGDGSLTSGSSVYSNTISNLSFNGTVYGLYLGSTASPSYPVNAYSNNVNSLSSSGASSSIYGTYVAGSATGVNFYKNKSAIINSTGATGVAYGLYISTGTNVRVYNNLVGAVSTPSSTGVNRANGIYIAGGTSMNLYYNSVYMSGTSTGANFGSNAIYANTTPNVNLINNVFVNNSVPTGTESATAYRRSSTTLTTYSSTSNNNLYYAGTPGASNLIYSDGTNALQTLSAFKTLVGTRDISSVTENPSFTSIVATAANYLNVNTVTPTQIESGGSAISGITDDYAATIRNTVTPDIGAWEGNYTILDVNAPVMVSSGFSTPGCIISGRTFTANYSDAGGVATGLVAPRIYYKLNAGAYTSVSGTLTSGTVNNGVWTFNMVYSATLGDVVSYFVVAQDVTSTPNIMASPSAGFVGSDVNTITSNPTTPNTYGINALNGVYTVGSTGTFSTLTAASIAYNTYCLTGPVTFSLVDALYSTAETFPIVFQNNTDASATNSLLIRPATGLAVAITPTNTAASSVIKFLNARYITMDGIKTSGSSLDINNANSTSASANLWLASSGPGNNFIAFKNLNLKGGYSNGSNGVIASVDGSVPSGTGGSDNDNISIIGNSFLTFYQGILAVGTASVSSGGLDNWIISSNIIGPATSGTANIVGNGVYVNGGVNLAINSNTIQNLAQVAAGGGIALINNATFTVSSNVIQNFSTTSTGCYGINANSNNSGFAIVQNTIMNLYSSASSSGVNSIAGLYLGTGVITGTVNRNNIHTIENTSTSGYGARGLIVNTSNTASNLFIRNNFISDIASYSDASALYWPIGIAIEGTSGTINVDFNSVNLFGSHTGLTSASASSPIYINSTGGNISLKNNMLSNTYDNTTSSTDITYGIYSNVASSNISSINYNNYSVGGGASSLVLGYLGSNQTNLAGIQTAFGGNVNSKNIAPVYTSNTDLHMQPVSGNVGLDNQGTPIVGITVDIDNQIRNVTTPDMGADEFTVPTCTTANGGVLTAATATACAGQTLVATSTGASIGLTTSYLWKVSATAGGPYSPVTGGTGSTTTSYTSAALPAGVYYVVLETICSAVSMTAVSNEGTLTVSPAPTASATSTTTLLCSGQNISLSGSSNIGTSYSWAGPNNYTTTTQNPSITGAIANASGNYSLFTAVNGCTSTPGVVSITVSSIPSAITLSPASATICAGSSQTVGALGASIPSVFNFTPQTNQNATTGYPAPYSAYYGGQKMQFLVLASELSTQGLSAGLLTSIQFPVVSLGSNWGTSINDNQSFQVSIKATPLTSVGSTFETGLTVVSSVTNFTPAVGYNNTHTFGTPFFWNGTSNLIIETVFSNNIAGTTSDAVVQYNSATPFQSTMVYRADNQTFATMAAATTTNYATNLIRPDFKLYQNIPVTFTWTPAAGLSTTSGSSVNATPASSTIYTVVARNGLNTACTSSASVSLSVTPMPTVTIVASASAACVGNTVNLTAGGALSYLWDDNSTTTVITVSPALTTVYTVTGQTQFCGGVTETISIVANPLPTVTAVSTATGICAGQSATLTGGGALNYAWVSGPLTSSYVVSPSTATDYTVVGTDALGCSDQATVSVVINTVTPITVSPLSATVCASSPASFTAAGASTYSWSTGANTATTTIISITSGSYTVTGLDANGCSSSQTISLTANALPTVAISPASPTICSNESIVLTGSGASSYSWMPGTNTTTTLMVNASATSSSYTLEGVDVNNCKNAMTVTVTVDPCTGLSEKNGLAGKVSLYPNPSTGLITADFGFEGSKEITVLNSIGAVVMKANTEELMISFNLSDHAKGVYFVYVKTNDSSTNFKIVIQ